jgi:subtilisin family serine protease
MIPDLPTRERAEREAQAARDTIAYFRQHGVRVVNMSWGGSPRDIEGAFEANGAGGTPEERRQTAREYFQIFRQAMTEAMAAAPEILFVAAAGNSDNDAAFAEFVPSGIDLPNVLTVGAVDHRARRLRSPASVRMSTSSPTASRWRAFSPAASG